jgi:hypothetical protein
MIPIKIDQIIMLLRERNLVPAFHKVLIDEGLHCVGTRLYA